MKCSNCDGNIIIKLGQYGLFGACDNFPKCRVTRKLHDVLYELIKQEGVNIYAWNKSCWNCGKTTKVYTYFLNKQLKKHMQNYLELGNLGLGTIQVIDNYLKDNIDTININYSKTRNGYFVSNNCEHCQKLIGNNFVVDDPHEIFDDWINSDVDKYKVSNIPFDKLSISVNDLKGLEHDYVQIG